MKLVANFPDFNRPGSHLLLLRNAGAIMDWTELTLMSPRQRDFSQCFLRVGPGTHYWIRICLGGGLVIAETNLRGCHLIYKLSFVSISCKVGNEHKWGTMKWKLLQWKLCPQTLQIADSHQRAKGGEKIKPQTVRSNYDLSPLFFHHLEMTVLCSRKGMF